MSHTEVLGEQIAGLQFEAIPEAVRARLKTCLLYGMVMAATAGPRDSLETAVRLANDAPGPAQVLASDLCRSAADAAYINAFRMCARGQNDTYAHAYAHPGCIVIPVVLALAQHRNADGKQLLTAMAAGYEALAAIAADQAGAVVGRRFRATSVFGVFASTAAAARLMGLDAAQCAHALSLATQYSAGTMQCWAEGTPEWRLQVGNAARAGIACATLAGYGFPGARHALEGDSGFYQAFAGRAATGAPRWSWQASSVIFKPLPGCLINQAPLYLLLALQRRHGFEARQVERIDVWLSERNAAYPGIDRHGPFQAATGAVMSCPFMLAVGLRDRTLRMPDFEALHGPGDIHALSRRVHVQPSAALPDWGARLRVRLDDGATYDDEMTELSRFGFDWTETDTLLSAMADEWPWPDGAQRYQRLRRCVDGLEQARDIQELVSAVCDA